MKREYGSYNKTKKRTLGVMSDRQLRRVPLNQIHFEEGVLDIVDSPAMEPYIQFHQRISRPGADVRSCLADIAKLPLHDRYVWRIASALKWGLGDYDSGSVAIDRDTLSPEDLAKFTELLVVRPYQFCRLLSVLFGADKMEQLMSQAIVDAKQRS
jgi:hypothetical protein